MRLGSFGKHVALVLGLLSIATSAAAQSPAFKAAVLGSRAAPYPGATFALDFVGAATGGRQYYLVNGAASSQFSTLPGLTVARATPPIAYAANASGDLVPFGPNIARITNLGLLSEEVRTIPVLWNRDLTNAAWVKTNITAALDQTGADGAASAASSITATASNGTVCQSITLASSARFQTAYVKRITGSGAVSMSMDNGATYTVVTVTSAYTRVSIPTQTLANPAPCFKLATSGDAVAVDFVANENGTFATSPFATTTVAVTRALDLVSVAGLSLNAAGGTILEEIQYSDTTTVGAARGAWSIGSTNALGMDRFSTDMAIRGTGLSGGGSATGFSIGAAPTKMVAAFAVTDVAVSVAGAAPFTSAALTTMPAADQIVLGRGVAGVQTDGYIRRIVYYPTRQPNAQVQASSQ